MDNHSTSKKYDLEDRLIDFTILIVDISDTIFNTKAGEHIEGQIIRSGSNPALHYGEAQSAESRKDFIHKLKVLLKELRETRAALKIIRKRPLTNRLDLTDKALPECNELISTFVASINTAGKNMENENKKK